MSLAWLSATLPPSTKYPLENPMKTFTRSVVSTLALGSLVGLVGIANADVAATTQQPAFAAKANKDNPFTLSVSNGKAAVGKSGTISVRITAGEGHKPNAEYPNKIKKLSTDDGATLGSTSVRGSVSGKSIVFSIPVTPNKAGKHTVKGQVRFSVCNDQQCYIKKVPLNATITGT